jgi:hypothetical protein
VGWCCGILWSGTQAAVPIDEYPELEPAREPGRPVTVVLVTQDGSWVSDTIDRISGAGGYSHAFLDVGHIWPDGRRMIVDYRPGQGVHYAYDDAYAERPKARVALEGAVGEQVWGCVRAKLGEPFDAAGALVGKCTIATCAGLIWGCLPPELRGQVACSASGRPISPNDLALLFDAREGETVTWSR